MSTNEIRAFIERASQMDDESQQMLARLAAAIPGFAELLGGAALRQKEQASIASAEPEGSAKVP